MQPSKSEQIIYENSKQRI